MKLFTERDYLEAIENLKLGLQQLKPDCLCCSICGDDGHQAFECHHNPLSVNYIQREFWRCYHCNEIFIDHESARAHFGNIPEATPRCIFDKCLCLDCSNNPTKCSGRG